MIAFGQTRGQMIVVRAVPVTDVSLMVSITAVTLTVAVPVTVITIVVGAAIATIVLVVAVAIPLGRDDGAGKRQRQQHTCARSE